MVKEKKINPRSVILNILNQKVVEYVNCADEVLVTQFKLDIALLVSQYYIHLASANKSSSMFGSVYTKVLDKTLDNVKKSGLSKFKLSDKYWFIRLFKDMLYKENGTIKRLRVNEGYSTKVQKDYVDKVMISLYEKYDFPISNRPGAKTDREDGLNPVNVENTVRKMFETRPDIDINIVNKEVATIVNIVKNVHTSHDATAFDNGSEDDIQVSMKDKYAIDKNARDFLDARRFIACALKFYGAIHEPKFKKYAKHYITYRLFVAKPSENFMNYIFNYEDEDILDKDWLEYLEEYDTDGNKDIFFYDVLPNYIKDRNMPEKLVMKTARDTYNKAYENLLSKLIKEKEFAQLKY